MRAVSHPGTRIIVSWYSRAWQPVLHLLEALGLKYPLPFLNWTTVGDIENLLRLAGFESIRARGHVLLPSGSAPSAASPTASSQGLCAPPGGGPTSAISIPTGTST